MFFRAAALAALHIRVSGSSHGVEEIILENAVGFFQNGFAFCGQHGITVLVQRRLGNPLLTAADLHDGLLHSANQRLVLAAFAPKDLLFHHWDVHNMKMVQKLYLSAILDLCDRRIVSYELSEHNDNPLVFKTFD